MKSKIKTRNLIYKQYIKNGRFESEFVLLETFITELNELIFSCKSLYFENLRKKTKYFNITNKNVLVSSQNIL